MQVLVIEIPSEDTTRDFQTSCEIIHSILKLGRNRSLTKRILSKEEFKKYMVWSAGKQFDYVHIICHADSTGIAINPKKEGLSWVALSNILKKSNHKNIIVDGCLAGSSMSVGKLVKSSVKRVFAFEGEVSHLETTAFWAHFYSLLNRYKEKYKNKNIPSKVLREKVMPKLKGHKPKLHYFYKKKNGEIGRYPK